MSKKILALFLAVIIAAVFVACTSGQTSSQASSPANSGGGASKTATPTGDELTEDGVTPMGVFPIVKDKLTISVLIAQLPHVSDITTNDYTIWLEEKTNIHLDMTVVPDVGFEEKKNLLLSTGDYPEIMMSKAANNNNEIVKYGMDEKIYIPLNSYIEKYSQHLAARLNEMPELKEGMTAPDGNIYTLPVFEGFVGHGAVSFKQWINQSWLDKLGLSAPTTTEEYREVLRAFKTKDPNGNGKPDEVPLSGAINTWAADPYYFIMNAFEYFDWSLVKMKGGKFETVADTDNFRAGLKFMSELYSEGLIDPSSLTQELAQLTQLANNEADLLGAYSGGHIGMGIDVSNKALFDKWTYILPLKGPDGYQGTPVSDKQAVNGGPFAITDKCKNPAAAFRMADLWFGDYDSMPLQEYYKGKTWEPATSGAKGVTGYDAIYKIIVPYSTEPTKIFWAATTATGSMKEAKLYAEFVGDPKESANYEGYLIQVTDLYTKMRAPYDQIMPTWADAETATSLNNTFTPINDYVKASIVDFITGKMNIDTEWDKYLEGLDRLGYKQYVKDTEAAYNK